MGPYKPGTLAIATVRGVEGVRVFRDDEDWHSDRVVAGCLFHGEFVVADIRPLVVLDLGDDPRRYVHALRWVESQSARTTPFIPSPANERNLVDDLARYIEAQSQPSRIPEPGLWGVVNAREADAAGKFDWVHTDQGWTNHHGYTTSWSRLMNPTLVRDGIES